MNIIYYTIIILIAIVALLEKKLISIQRDKNKLKDKYSHDLGNIFQAIIMAYDINDTFKNQQEEMTIIIRKKINEASELVKFIRNL